MVRRNNYLSKNILFYVVIAFFLSGCPVKFIPPTIHYPSIQNDFNRGEYQKVDTELSDATINALDPKLQFNAYTLKAFSEWQIGKLAEAKQTAATAMAKPGLAAGPRDKFMLSILPALVDSDELYNKYQKLPEPKQITMQIYKNDYENGYKQIIASLKNAYSQAPADVPKSILDYAHCQRGKTLKNWFYVMTRIWDGSDNMSDASLNLVEEAQNGTKQFLGTTVKDEIKIEEKYPCPETKELLAG
jgi:hypothetical protein